MSPWGVDGGGRCIAAGGAGPGSEQPHGSPRCGAGQLRPPARVPAGGCGRPEPRGGCPGEGAQPRSPPPPKSLRTRGDSAGKFAESHILEGNKKESTPSSPKTPVGCRWPLPPLGLRPPTCRAPQSRAAAGISLPAGLASAATLLRLFLSSSLPLLLPPPPPLSLSLLLGALYGDSFIHAFPSVPQRFPASRRQSV